jgi:dipeptidase E
MKLLLTSHGWKYNPRIAKEFLRLTAKEPSEIMIFLVTTADKKSKDWKWVGQEIKMITDIGITKKNISIFSLNRKIKRNELADRDIVYVCGGNTFLYLYGVRKTGLDKEIIRFTEKGGFYYGVSAGSVLAGPNIAIAKPFDDRRAVNLKNYRGLHLTDVVIGPHYEGGAVKILDAFKLRSQHPTVLLTNEQALEIVGRKKRLIR